MRSLLICIFGLVVMIRINAQDFDDSRYGFTIYQSTTGSGYGSNANINVNVEKYNRVLEVGVMLSLSIQQIRGFEFSYKHFLGFHLANFYKKAFKPYFHYIFLYRAPAEVIVNPSSAKSIGAEYTGGKMTTLEHAVGLGGQLKLVKQFYADGNIGVGVYFGSRYQGLTPRSWGIHLNNYGFIPSCSLGLGYQF